MKHNKKNRKSLFPSPARTDGKRSGHPLAGLQTFFILWATQSLSTLGSSMTSFALIIWSYQQEGMALTTSLLSVCSYAPYVLLSVFAGALSDRFDKRRTMLVCDTFAALTTLTVLFLLQAGLLQVWHLYVINALNGVMNTFQQPAADVAVSVLAPKAQYQRVSGLQSFSNSLVSILTPMIATALLGFAGMSAVIAVDLATFVIAFVTLLFFIRIPKVEQGAETAGEKLLKTTFDGVRYLWQNRGILDLILFLAAINFTASVYHIALPAMLLSRPGGSEMGLALISTMTGIANVAGSVAVSLAPAPKSRVRVIMNTLLFAMSTENLLLALGRGLPVWCFGAVLGWLMIPMMNTNLSALLRTRIPLSMQGRVYAARNSLQFFTIPLGYLAGGVLIDRVFEPFMAARGEGSLFILLLGGGKGSGAALLFLLLSAVGIATCLFFRRDRHIWALESKEEKRDETDAATKATTKLQGNRK